MKKSIFYLSILLSFLFISCYSWFETKVPIDMESKQGTLTDLFSQKKENTVLYAPKQVFASQALYPDSISISWTTVDGATSYRIEKAIVKPQPDGTYNLPEESDFFVIKEFSYKTVYTDKILTNPTATNEEYTYKYYYRICAENISKALDSSPFTDYTKSETSGCGWLLTPPKNVEAWKGKSVSEIQLSWQPTQNAQNYQIFRGEKENGSGMELLDIVRGNQTSYINSILTSEQGIEFFYKVKAITSNDTSSADSNIAMGYSLKNGAPVIPDNITTKDAQGKSKQSITITWNQVNPVLPEQTYTYSLYRTSSVDSVYTLIKNNIPNTTTSYTDTSVKPGIIYYYYLQTVCKNSLTNETIKGTFSETGPESKTPVSGYLLSAPNSLEVEDSENKDNKTLVWYPAIGTDFSAPQFSYNIYYSETQTGPYSLLEEKILPQLNENGFYTYETQKKSFYVVSTINEDLESDYSNAAAPSPNAPENVKASKTQKLDTLFEPNANGVYPVKITWNKPSDDNPSGYLIYRSTKPDSSFRKITEEPIKETFYIDINETSKAGIYYYYKVISLNSLNQGKKSNNPETDTKLDCVGYGALTREQWFREYNKTVVNSLSKLTLMHKPNDLDKIGSESAKGTISGTLGYKSGMDGVVTMPYTDYCDYYILDNKEFGPYFVLNGNSNTKIEGNLLKKSGHMNGTVKCTGMYPGWAFYDKVEINGGSAGGGTYGVTTFDLENNVVLENGEISWLIGEER